MKRCLLSCSFVCFITLCIVGCKKQDGQAMVIPVPPPPIEGKTYSANEIAAFKEMTFNATGNHLLYKLPAEVSVFVTDTTNEQLYPAFVNVINELNGLLAGATHFTLVTRSIGATIVVYFTNRDAYLLQEPLEKFPDVDFVGLAVLGSYYNAAWHHGSVFVDTTRVNKNADEVAYVLGHEMMHALGFIGHADATKVSTILTKFPITPYLTDYTAFDKKMMLLLYNSSISNNMDEAAFNAVVVNL